MPHPRTRSPLPTARWWRSGALALSLMLLAASGLAAPLVSAANGSFEDVPPEHWAFPYIEILYQQGYVAGCSADPPHYCPEEIMSRAESAVFVVRGVHGAGFDPSDPSISSFTDVQPTDWFADWVEQLWVDGYTAGCATDPLRYCPLQQHTIAEGTVFFLRMMNGAEYKPPPPEGIFADVQLEAWYADWVEEAYRRGLLRPCQTEPFLRACPLDPLDRAYAAYMMVMAKGLMPHENVLYVDNSVASSGDGSLQAPFKTIAEGLEALQPGMTLYIRGDQQGRVYNEPLDPARPGRPDAPIRVAAYPGEKVIIASSGEIMDLDQPYWHFVDLIFDHLNGSGDALQIHGGDGALFERIELRNGRRNGIQIFDGDDIVIRNSLIHSFDTGTPGDDAHCIVTDPTSSSRTVDRLQLIGNIIYDCSGDGIQFYATSSTPLSEYARDALIQRNIFYKNAAFYGENAIDAKGAIHVRVIGNEMYGFDSNKVVVIQKGSSYFTFEDNVIHDSHRGIEMRGEGGKSQAGHVLRRNVFYNIYGEYVIKFDDVSGGVVQHNTLVDNQAESFRIEEEGLVQGDIRNNLIVSTGAPRVSGTLEAILGNNGWFSSDAARLGHPGDIQGQDPRFVDRAGHDYHLLPGSPAIDRGVDLGEPFHGKAPDLGAFEWQ